MRDTIKLVAKQIHELLPSKTIAITRFNSEYKYGQLYLGELDRSVQRNLMGKTFVKRNFVIVYSQDPTMSQETGRTELEEVCCKFEDFILQRAFPIWHKVFLDVFETTLTLTFQVWERYEYSKTPADPKMEDLETDLPYIYYDDSEPEPEQEPEEEPEEEI